MMNIKKALGLIAALGAVACGAEGEGEWAEVEYGSLSQSLWVGAGARLWQPGTIQVCFDNVDSSLRPFIRSTVTNGWERAAALAFSGWESCSSLSARTSNLIVVSVDTGISSQGLSSHCTQPGDCDDGGLGKAPNGDYNLIRFNSNSRAAMPAIILHEFGHALGFLHESEDFLPNGDRNLECGPNRSSGGTSFEYEDDFERSIMTAYVTVCNPEVTTLSSWDILGARAAYGYKHRGTIVGTNGLSLNIQGGATERGAKIIGWNGSGSWNNRFVRQTDDSLLLTATSPGGTRRVLNVRGGSVDPNNATEVISWPGREEHENSQFRFQGVQWLAMGDRCVTASRTTRGALLSVNECRDGNSRQRWDFFDGDRRIRLSGTDQCVNVPRNATTNGTQLILFPCSTGTPFVNETFEFEAGKIKYSGKAFNIQGGTVSDGGRLILWTTATTTPFHNERFTIRGPITSMGQCLDMMDTPELGVPIGVRACSDTTAPLTNTQVWEYFW